MRLADADQKRGPQTVDHPCRAIDGKAEHRRIQKLRRADGANRLAHDQERGNDNEHPFQNGRQILRLVVTKRMVGIRRLLGIANDEIGHEGRNDVDGRLKTIGKQRHRAGHVPRKKLQPHDPEGQRNAPEGKPFHDRVRAYSHVNILLQMRTNCKK